MADLYSNAKRQATSSSGDQLRKAILEVASTELQLSTPVDFKLLDEKLFSPLRSNKFQQHIHLEQPITIMFPATTSNPPSPSPPIFNVFDALSAIHTIAARKYRVSSWDGAIPGGPPSIKQILISLRSCCRAFGDNKTRPTMIGYAVVIKHDLTVDSNEIQFGCSAGGTGKQKLAIAAQRTDAFGYRTLLARQQAATYYVQHQIGYGPFPSKPPPDYQLMRFVCGNCAESACFPVPSGTREEIEERYSRPLRSDVAISKRLECRAIEMAGKDEIKERDNCKNCEMQRYLLKKQGFEIEDMAGWSDFVGGAGATFPPWS